MVIAAGFSIRNNQHNFAAIAFTFSQIRSSSEDCIVEYLARLGRRSHDHTCLAGRYDCGPIDHWPRNRKWTSDRLVRPLRWIRLEVSQCLHGRLERVPVWRKIEDLRDILIVTVHSNLIEVAECAGQCRETILDLGKRARTQSGVHHYCRGK